MPVHASVKWGVSAAVVTDHWLQRRDLGRSRLIDGVAEGMLVLSVMELIERIEMDLKTFVSRYLRRTAGQFWWSSMPSAVVRSAEARHKWSAAALGHRHVARFPDVCWLTMGDVARVLRELDATSWRKCLNAEVDGQYAFNRELLRIKAFRDYYIAHPKPRKTTSASLRSLCASCCRMPRIICPSDWSQAIEVLIERRNVDLVVARAAIADRPPHGLREDGKMTKDAYTALLKWWDDMYGYGVRA